MRISLLLSAATLLATSTFAQSVRPPVTTERPRPPVATSLGMAAPHSHYRFHARFATDCCANGFDSFGPPASDSATAQSFGVVYASGGPDFQPSSYVPFREAVARGEQQAGNLPFAPSKDATVQQMLDLIQATRAAREQIHDDGESAPVKWSDLKPTINPSDYRRPLSTYVDYQDAVALGESVQQQNTQPTPSLGELAQEAKESRPADEKPAVVVRQNADGTPRVIEKDQPAQEKQQTQAAQPQ